MSQPPHVGLLTLALLACGGPTRGREPDIVVEPSTAVLFGRVVVGSNARTSVIVRNVGQADLIVSGATLEGAASPFSVDPATLPAAPLPPGEAHALEVVYQPTVGAPTEDFLRIASNDPDQPTLTLPVRSSNNGPHLRVDPPLVDFGLVAGRAGPVTAQVVNDGTEAVTIDAIELLGAEFALADPGVASGTVLQPGDGFELTVIHAVVLGDNGTGRVTIGAIEAGAPDAVLELRGQPVAVPGPEIDVEPLVAVTLDGTASRAPGNAVTGYRWTVVESAAGSQTAVDFAAGLVQVVRGEVRCPAGQNTIAMPCFFPDVPGIYRFGLVVVDERPVCALQNVGETCSGSDECCSFDCGASVCQVPAAGAGVCRDSQPGCEIASVNVTEQVVRAIPDQAVFVSVSWDGAGDIDLHMVRDSGAQRAWTTSPDDVFWFNPQPDWGNPDPTNGMTCLTSPDCTMAPFTSCLRPPGAPSGTCIDTTDDPRLLIDVTDGFGPEAIGMKLPPPDTYHVGVHFYPDEHMAPRRATVRVFVLGEERFPPGFGPGSPMTVILDRNDFWYVGRVVVPAVIDNVTVEEQPLSLSNPKANAEPSGYPAIP